MERCSTREGGRQWNGSRIRCSTAWPVRPANRLRLRGTRQNPNTKGLRSCHFLRGAKRSGSSAAAQERCGAWGQGGLTLAWYFKPRTPLDGPRRVGTYQLKPSSAPLKDEGDISVSVHPGCLGGCDPIS